MRNRFSVSPHLFAAPFAPSYRRSSLERPLSTRQAPQGCQSNIPDPYHPCQVAGKELRTFGGYSPTLSFS